jgi:uncharacterized protein (TIGR00661 family)
MTQAMAASEWLASRGHELIGVVIGESTRRTVPGFVHDALQVPFLQVASPNFVADDRGGVNLWKSVAVHSRLWFSHYEPALKHIEAHVRELQPDVIVNFFEGMTGLWALRRRPKVPIVAVAHQFMFMHPVYRFAPGAPLQQASLRLYTRIAAAGARIRLALSLYPAAAVPSRRLRVAGPILRREVHELAAEGREPDGSLLAYLMEPGLADELERAADGHLDQRVDCFWDGPAEQRGPNMFFHPLDRWAFLEHMARCSGVLTTAGFEGIGEAMLLGKPALMVPVPGHYEQRCNAPDAERAGAGLAARTFDVGRLLELARTYRPPAGFQAWCAGAEAAFVAAVEDALS